MFLPFKRYQSIFYFYILLLFIMQKQGVSDEIPVAQKTKQLFEWGEYPQIIQTVPGYLSDTTGVIDRAEKSQLHLYLGVAYFAEGEVWKARDQFLTSLKLDSAAALDKNYVSREIYDLFLETAYEIKQRKIEEQKRIQLLEQNKQASQSRQAVIDSLDKSVKKARKRGLILTAVSTTVLSAGFAGLSVNEYYLGDQDYEKYKTAAQLGDYREYERFKAKVEKHDTRMVVFASASGGSAVLSTILYIVAHKKRKKNIRSSKPKPTIFIGLNSLCLHIDF